MKAFFEFRGSRIAYNIKGKGRSVLLIHGFLGNKSIWSDQYDRLSKKYKVIAIDLPGHGESESLGYIHEMEMMAQLIHALLKQLKIRKIVLIGHSLGGYVSLAFAELFPDSVLGLVLVNSTAKGDTAKKKKGRDQLIKMLKKDAFRPLELLVPSFFNCKTRKTHYFIRRYLNMAKKANRAGIVATIEGMKIRKEREIVLKFAPFPYLYLSGKFDGLLSPDELLKETQLNEQGQFELFENSSHMIFWEEKEKCYRNITQFLKKLNS